MEEARCSSTSNDVCYVTRVLRRLSHERTVDPVVIKGIALARDLVLHLLGESSVRLKQRDRLSLCLRKRVLEVLEKHAILFTKYAKGLACTPEETSEALVVVCDVFFQDKSVTWDHIICLYALAGRLALYYEEKNMHELARSIPRHMTRCIVIKVAPFVKRNGGWEQLCVEFPLQEDLSDKVWMFLLITGAGLGLAAAFLAGRAGNENWIKAVPGSHMVYPCHHT